jgi:hypothetical protein
VVAARGPEGAWIRARPHAGEMSRPGEKWPIVLAMRNWGFYLAVVAAAPIDRRRIRRPP